MPITKKQTVGLCEVTLEGDLTLPCMAEVREQLLEALDGASRISIDVAGVSSLDLSCLQVFCAMHKTSIEKKKDISFSAPFPPVVKEIMERTGYLTEEGCHRRTKGVCLLEGAGRG